MAWLQTHKGPKKVVATEFIFVLTALKPGACKESHSLTLTPD